MSDFDVNFDNIDGLTINYHVPRWPYKENQDKRLGVSGLAKIIYGNAGSSARAKIADEMGRVAESNPFCTQYIKDAKSKHGNKYINFTIWKWFIEEHMRDIPLCFTYTPWEQKTKALLERVGRRLLPLYNAWPDAVPSLLCLTHAQVRYFLGIAQENTLASLLKRSHIKKAGTKQSVPYIDKAIYEILRERLIAKLGVTDTTPFTDADRALYEIAEKEQTRANKKIQEIAEKEQTRANKKIQETVQEKMKAYTRSNEEILAEIAKKDEIIERMADYIKKSKKQPPKTVATLTARNKELRERLVYVKTFARKLLDNRCACVKRSNKKTEKIHEMEQKMEHLQEMEKKEKKFARLCLNDRSKYVEKVNALKEKIKDIKQKSIDSKTYDALKEKLDKKENYIKALQKRLTSRTTQLARTKHANAKHRENLKELKQEYKRTAQKLAKLEKAQKITKNA